jgi:hypothetical protein
VHLSNNLVSLQPKIRTNMHLKKIIPIIIAMFAMPFMMKAQVTTSSLSGTVKSLQNSPLIGATITAIHVPTGSKYVSVTRTGGRYDINNMNTGGPYTVIVTYSGFETETTNDVFLTLGETQKLDVELKNKSTDLTTVVVTGKKPYTAKNGTETTIGRAKLDILPTVGRNLGDFLRFTPQAKVNGASISIGGQNNRYNGFLIDGAVNNDVFGLSASGTNGGQAGTPPISIDAIEQLVVSVAPFDAAVGNFTGGAINAVTKSGTNAFHGSAYYIFRNQNLAGLTPNVLDSLRFKYPNFNNKTMGFTIGGPIIKNKAFFFVNAEKQKDNRPQPYTGPENSVLDSITKLVNHVKTKYNYDLGDFRNNEDKIERINVNSRFDFNLSDKQKLTLSYRYTKAERINANRSSYNGSTGSIAFTNGAQFFPSITNSGNLELNSKFNNTTNNKFRVSITDVNDDRSFVGNPFPAISIAAFNGGPSYTLGSEASSSANILKQNILNIYDAFKFYKGKNAFTIGADIDLNKSYNLFLNQNFGLWTYSALGAGASSIGPLQAFMQDLGPSRIQRSYSLVDAGNKSGDLNVNSAANFKSVRLGFFINDDIKVNNKLTVTLGLRADQTSFVTDVPNDAFIKDTVLPTISQFYDLNGASTGQKFKPSFIFSPRLGFKYLMDEENLTLRGGIGIFGGRTPLVWPGGIYANSGNLIGGLDEQKVVNGAGTTTGLSIAGTPIPFNSDVNTQFTQADFGLPASLAKSQGNVNLISKNFKLPSVWKLSAAADKKLGNGWNLTTELLFTKNINEVDWQNVNFLPQTVTNLRSTGPDSRDIYPTTGATKLTYRATGTALAKNPYNNIILIKNTDGPKGYAYNFTVKVDKETKTGFSFNAAYTYGNSQVYNEATSSVNVSNWQFMETVRGRNFNVRSTSDFDLGHRIFALVSKKFTYANKHAATTFTLTYNGQSGSPFSYVYSGTIVGDGVNGNDLMYIPASRAEMDNMAFVTKLTGAAATPAANAINIQEQKDQFEEFINSEKYLRKHRGQYADRNGARLPFTNVLDANITQDFMIKAGGTTHKLSLTFDIFNLTNLLNKNAGRTYFLSNDQTNVISFRGFQTGTTTPTFQFFKPNDNKPYVTNDVQTNPGSSARWNGQVTVRYSF